MNKEKFIRISSWALILGAITLTLGTIAVLLEPHASFRFGLIPTTLRLVLNTFQKSATNLAPLGQLLLAIGMLGLLYRYGDEVGRLGKGALAIGVIGGFVAASAFIDLFSDVWADPWISWRTGPTQIMGLNGRGVLYFGGLGVLYLSLIVFGVTALIRKPLPHWNWLPILAGIWIPLMIAADLVLELPRPKKLFFATTFEQLLVLGVSFSAVTLVLLGYVLQTDTHRDSAIA